MVRRLIPTLIAASCFFQANGYNPGFGMARQRLDIRNSIVPLSSTEDSLDSSDDSTVSDPAENMLLDLPPVIQQIVDERREFQVNLGKAMDTLRKDMPDIITKQPDYSIYHDDIIVLDDSGVRLSGIDSYKSAVSFLQTFVRFWFQQRSGFQFRMVYDFARSSIRVSWHAVLVPKVPLGKPLHVDGVSMYKLDSASGKIVEHKFESFVINNTPVAPPYGIFSLLQQDLLGMSQQVPVPAGVGLHAGI